MVEGRVKLKEALARCSKRFVGSALAATLVASGVPAMAFAVEPVSGLDEAADWVQLIGGAGSYANNNIDNAVMNYCDNVNDVVTLDDGSVVVVGTFDRSFELDDAGEPKKHSDAFIAKFSASGEKVFETTVGGTDYDYFNGVAALKDGSFAAVGFTRSEKVKSGSGGQDYGMANYQRNQYSGLVATFDSGGALKTAASFGGTSKDYLSSVAATSDGGFIAVGAATSKNGDVESFVLDKEDAEVKSHKDTGRDGVVVKYKADGTVEWVNLVGGKTSYAGDTSKYDELFDVVETADGGFATAGYTTSVDVDIAAGQNKGYKDGTVAKLDSKGALEWTANYGGSKNDELRGIALDGNSEGGLLLAGRFTSTDGDFEGATDVEGFRPGIIRTDKDGKVVKAASLEYAGDGLDVANAGDGYVLAGDAQFDGNNQDAFAAYYSADLENLSTAMFGDFGDERAMGIAKGADDRWFIGGVAGLDFAGKEVEGKYDGFLMSIPAWDLYGAAVQDKADAAAGVVTLGKAATKLKRGETYQLPVSAMRADDINTDSMMSGALASTATAKVDKDGTVTMTVGFQELKFMGVTANATEFEVFQHNNTDGDPDAATYKTKKSGNDTVLESATFAVPTSCKAADGVFIRINATGMPNAQTAFVKFDYAKAKTPAQIAAEADNRAAGNVVTLVNALPANPTAADKASIDRAKKAYDALTAAQKKLVPAAALDRLNKAEKAVAADTAARKVTNVTVNVKTVNATAVAKAVAKAKGNAKYIQQITLGSKVKSIKASAFAKYPAAKTLVVKSAKLKKSGVKKALKGSKVTKVKVPKKKLKAYKKIFTKKVCGKAVKVTK